MKIFIFSSLLLLSGLVSADEFSANFFKKLDGQIFLGKNNVSGKECTLSFFDTTLAYHWTEAISEIRDFDEALNRYMSIKEANEFNKNRLANELVILEKSSSRFTCMLFGKCSRYKTVLSYSDKGLPLSYTYFRAYNSNPFEKVEECIINK